MNLKSKLFKKPTPILGFFKNKSLQNFKHVYWFTLFTEIFKANCFIVCFILKKKLF